MNLENSNFKALTTNFALVWVVKTALAMMLGAAVGVTVAQLSFCARTVAQELLGAVLLGAIVGAFVGVAQFGQMRNVVHNPKWWVITNIAGWTIGLFLFEVNWPVSLCLTSSNAASYVPGYWIQAIHRPIYIIAEQIERMAEATILYGGIYITVTTLLTASLMGIVLGVPQGIGQWLALRKDLRGSSVMVWVNVLTWAIAYLLLLFVIELVNFDLALIRLLVPVVLAEPAAVTALTLVWLQKKQTGAGHS